ncbi:probable glutathione S-transferase GSTF2 [Lolium perenne]|uniref:probable glutathione S-transferase GSTF2 n=1 Tax=Lolium perenne TaxID=4522 RepID=UPI0021EB1401|nr:probable glutathione S-transferase GSTF2 [Lolium perenne]
MAPVVKVYGTAKSWNISRVLVSLGEAGVQYEIVAVDFAAGEHMSPAHLARNPFGQVPVLEDGDFCLWESRAITKYVCRKYKPELLRVGNLVGSATVDVWLEVEAQQYSPVMEAILIEIRLRPIFGHQVDERVVEKNIEKLKKVLSVYESRLSSSKYLAGDFISLADLNHVSTMLCLGITTYISVLDLYPNVRAWWDDLRARPAARKVSDLMNPRGP